jgi:Trk-type K+ transport system membrane component
MEFVVIMALMYFLPMIVALAKGCDSKGAIVLISLLLGWVPFVTIVCLIWAICGRTVRKQRAQARILAEAIAATR